MKGIPPPIYHSCILLTKLIQTREPIVPSLKHLICHFTKKKKAVFSKRVFWSHGRVSEQGHSWISLNPQVTMSDEYPWHEHHISHCKLFILEAVYTAA